MCDKATLENDGSVKTVHGCYKSQKIRNKAGNNYYHTLKFVSESFMTQKMCDKAFDNYPSTIKYVPEYYKTHEMFKAVHRCFFVFDSIPDQYKTREICDLAVSLFPFLTVYCPNK